MERVKSIAVRKGITAGQLALAWLQAMGSDIVPIPGTKRRKYLEENIAAEAVEICAADMAEIAEVLPNGAAAGSRYPESMMPLVNR